RANKTKKGQAVVSEAALLAAQAAEEKAKRDRKLNLERQQQQAKKAKLAELRQIIDTNKINDYDGDIVYHFADGKQVKTLNVNSKIHRGLVVETIRIVRFGGSYILISSEAAEKVEKRDKEALIKIPGNDDSISKEDQDYYAQFEIPDDLVW
ncbi:MAG TPA: DUF2058 domain-containing protein, partial [Thiomicrospira sp.]|nr:DUF2058 domain-containing protein [Thiomicrospira sp.]